jgi:transposase
MTSRGAEKMIPSTIGVDISKDFLGVHRLPDGQSRRFDNNTTGHKMLIRWLSETPIARIVYEPTGPYHRSFEQTLANADLPLAKVNARQARRFAEATGKLAKTDRADAAMLARMGVALTIAPRPASSEMLSELKELNLARQALIKDRTAAKNRSKILSLRLLKRQNAQRCKQIEAQIAAIEEEIKARIAEDEQLAERLSRHSLAAQRMPASILLFAQSFFAKPVRPLLRTLLSHPGEHPWYFQNHRFCASH